MLFLGGKYITSKKQLIGHKPPKPVKKVSYVPHPPPIQTNLPPPTNLTTQDIMDLPIIFADDNQLLDPNTVQPEIIPPPPPVQPQPSKIITSAGNKFVVLNKQVTSQSASNFIITPTNIRKIQPMASMKNPKYTKIILSKRDETKNSGVMSQISNLSPEISVRRIIPEKQSPMATSQFTLSEPIDLEAEIVATAVPKPNIVGSELKNITIFSKKAMESIRTEMHSKPITMTQSIKIDDCNKRTASEAEMPDKGEFKHLKLSLE